MQTTELTSRKLTIRNRSVHALEKGTDGPLMVHGWLDNANTFVPLLGLLDRGLAIDLPGHGFSDWRGGANEYHFVDWFNDLHGIVTSVSASTSEPVDLIGHSLGGAICLLYAGLFPDRVRRVAMIDSLGPLVNDDSEIVDQLRVAIPRRFKQWTLREYDEASDLIDARMAGLSYLSRAGATLLAEGATLKAGEKFVFSHDPALKLKSLLRLTEKQVRVILSSVACPTLLIRPDSGFSFPSEIFEARSACIADFERTDVVGHHHVHLDNPERIAPIIRSFFESS